jgi:hypothetical protein
VVDQIGACKWEIDDFMDSSPYIATLIREFEFLKEKIHTLGASRVPKSVQTTLWTYCIRFAMEQLVEGYSRIKKCNNEGRALMSLDLKTLTTQLERHTGVHPVPHQEFVDGYIKAWYSFKESDIQEWLSNARAKGYTKPQLVALVKSQPEWKKVQKALLATIG